MILESVRFDCRCRPCLIKLSETKTLYQEFIVHLNSSVSSQTSLVMTPRLIHEITQPILFNISKFLNQYHCLNCFHELNHIFDIVDFRHNSLGCCYYTLLLVVITIIYQFILLKIMLSKDFSLILLVIRLTLAHLKFLKRLDHMVTLYYLVWRLSFRL